MNCHICGETAPYCVQRTVKDELVGISLCGDHYKAIFPDPIEANPLGAKETKGKPRFSLLPRKGCLAVISAREYGAVKYGDPENWKKVPQKEWIEATLRHLYAHLDGELVDPESGLPHLSHAACSAFLACSAVD